MGRTKLDDLAAFAAVARLRSYTRAAAVLGTSTSNLSHTIRRLEARLGVRLLARNSRSVAPTENGAALLATVAPALDGIDEALEALGRAVGHVGGTLRLTATRESYVTIVRPILPVFAAAHPEATVEVLIEHGVRDIVAGGFDAGIRSGEDLEADMVALRIGPDLRMAVVATPDHLERHGTPAHPAELAACRCINYRLSADGPLYSWEFRRGAEAFTVRVGGPLTLNEPDLVLEAARAGVGVAFVLEHAVAPDLRAGRLVRLFPEWTPTFPGFFLYYPSRRLTRPVLAAFIAMLRRRQTVDAAAERQSPASATIGS